MMIAAGEKCGTGGRTKSRGVKVVIAVSSRSQPVDVWRRDLGPEATQVGESEIVEENHDDVGTAGRSEISEHWLAVLVREAKMSARVVRR